MNFYSFEKYDTPLTSSWTFKMFVRRWNQQKSRNLASVDSKCIECGDWGCLTTDDLCWHCHRGAYVASNPGRFIPIFRLPYYLQLWWFDEICLVNINQKKYTQVVWDWIHIRDTVPGVVYPPDNYYRLIELAFASRDRNNIEI